MQIPLIISWPDDLDGSVFASHNLLVNEKNLKSIMEENTVMNNKMIKENTICFLNQFTNKINYYHKLYQIKIECN